MFTTNNSQAADRYADDYMNRIENAISRHYDEEDFPKMDSFDVERNELSDYLFDKQAILDSEGTERSRYTIYGIIMVIPIVVVAAIPDKSLPYGKMTVLIAILIGIILCVAFRLVQKTLINLRIGKLDTRKKECKSYADAVGAFIAERLEGRDAS